MFDIGASFDREIMSIARIRPTVLFIEPEDPRVVEAALRLPRFARPVFLTSREKVEAVIPEETGLLGVSFIIMLYAMLVWRAFAIGAAAQLRDARFAGMQKQLEEEGIEGVLAACVRCHNCMTVCPICYCKTCLFKSPPFDHEPMPEGLLLNDYFTTLIAILEEWGGDIIKFGGDAVTVRVGQGDACGREQSFEQTQATPGVA